MKCFECGGKCITAYLNADLQPIYFQDEVIKAVRKNCIDCDWHSYPTKIPEPI